MEVTIDRGPLTANVTIWAGGVDKDEPRLSKRHLDEMSWRSKIKETAVKIEFNDLVFLKGRVFNIPANGSEDSGKINPDIPDEESYAYTVTRVDTGEELDPTVFIDK